MKLASMQPNLFDLVELGFSWRVVCVKISRDDEMVKAGAEIEERDKYISRSINVGMFVDI